MTLDLFMHEPFKIGVAGLGTVGSGLLQGGVLMACNRLGWPALPTIIAVAAGGALGWYLVARTIRHPALAEIAKLGAGLRHRGVPRA